MSRTSWATSSPWDSAPSAGSARPAAQRTSPPLTRNRHAHNRRLLTPKHEVSRFFYLVCTHNFVSFGPSVGKITRIFSPTRFYLFIYKVEVKPRKITIHVDHMVRIPRGFFWTWFDVSPPPELCSLVTLSLVTSHTSHTSHSETDADKGESQTRRCPWFRWLTPRYCQQPMVGQWKLSCRLYR